MGISKIVASVLIGGGAVGGGATWLVLQNNGHWNDMPKKTLGAAAFKDNPIYPVLGQATTFLVKVNNSQEIKLDCNDFTTGYVYLSIDRATDLKNLKLDCSLDRDRSQTQRPFSIHDFDGKLYGQESFKCWFKGEAEITDNKKTYRYECEGGNPKLKGELVSGGEHQWSYIDLKPS
ncbi:hypothetical protein MHLP_03910 [Candidatus Mycoplasma haematolamae str. Purdue]|uniref:Uncharacterized protein n=1 Tax=Mycoplasma haematolamae (strain Purdue) TaxID=1212765 RepID=I7C727_MYCHA|nr:hypothetical protein [Candidatus Mycoplasma haematolamae]AFO52362.1 hypothetical protein MHLP_03910 [Candidatus Mycoplasma haematolamae str. Purdue]